MKDVLESVKSEVEKILLSMGLELFDISFKKERGRWVLRIIIDDPNGYVSIAQCENVSVKVSDYLDREDPIPYSYVLEVSSPGLDRPLRGLNDYKRFVGKLAKFWLVNGQVHVGRIESAQENQIVLDVLGEKITFRPEDVKRSRLEIEF
ncbi:ribosome maturation factor RimP [Pseudothermotoga hypogea DSM 11164 = NBRC 106472]|uniref:Ribosome maturation factor RimP n=1 Tax=Pseudothermotoga hypogea DSM 11164 = NBRC 106472 TaxID=1123384 RepID=A0A0X1KRS5_9THEM|nr:MULTISPECIES: ribosome maturation factor [Pseudothermotoga]AJC73929.1 ribosome maturation factor RimP [Pseudothermotoga hypogea DSM 11164 = NBRC 106472]MBC7122686.1 ribosome maturation factor [Pseudothermotoga sp.]MDI6863340.1 ribosome maturation factor [Pseudothermotoga sp.]